MAFILFILGDQTLNILEVEDHGPLSIFLIYVHMLGLPGYGLSLFVAIFL
jgi:hypothetical protein